MLATPRSNVCLTQCVCVRARAYVCASAVDLLWIWVGTMGCGTGNTSEPYYRDTWKDWGDATVSRGAGTVVGEMMIANFRHPHHQFQCVFEA